MNVRFLLAGCLATLLLLGVAPASAQTAPVLTLTPSTTSVTLGPNASKEVTWSLENTGPTGGDVTLSVNQVPGWTYALKDADKAFTMASGGTRSVTIKIEPASGTNPKNDSLVLTGRIRNAAAQGNDPTSTVALNYQAPAIPPPPPPPAPKPNYALPITLSIFGALALIGAGAYLLQARSLNLQVAAPDLITVGGSDTNFDVRVLNKSRIERNVELRIQGLPRPWAAAFSFPTVHLVGNETGRVPLILRTPIEAEAGHEVQFQIQARPNRFSPWLVASTLRARVADIPRPATTIVRGPHQ